MRFSIACRAAGYLLLAAAAGRCNLRSQAPPVQSPSPTATAAQDASTLHVYINLVQIPVLLLDGSQRPLPPIPASNFLIRIEGLEPFKPTRVRRQGEDPISLVILIDKSNQDEHLWDGLGRSAADLLAGLRPHDHVEIYAVDGCKLRNFLSDEPVNPEHLRVGLENAAAAKSYASQKKQLGPCAKPVSLWAAMYYSARMLGQGSGRRVMLVLSKAEAAPDDTIDQLHHRMMQDSTTVFAVHSPLDTFSVSVPSTTTRGRGAMPAPQMQTGPTSLGGFDQRGSAELQRQAEMSGGMVVEVTPSNLSKKLAEVVQISRGRYILEFPRPTQLGAGTRAISVSVGNNRHFIRPAGISLPLATSAETATDPTVEHGLNQPLPPEPDPPATTPVPAQPEP